MELGHRSSKGGTAGVGGGHIMGWQGWLLGVLLLLPLLLVHFVLLCPLILEPDLHMTFSKPPLAASSDFP